MATVTATPAVERFTTQSDFTEFLAVGSTPELEVVQTQLQARIAAFPQDVRSALKDLYQARLSSVHLELTCR